jgi:recombination protein RecR
MISRNLESFIQMLSKLPGFGPRSARRAALHLIKNKETLFVPLINAMEKTARSIAICSSCGNYDTSDICSICSDSEREQTIICVVEEVADLWALERTSMFKGNYHVLGGVLSPLDGIGPDDLRIDSLISRVRTTNVEELILATSATVDGKTTSHYIADRFQNVGIKISLLAHGIPVGGELDYLDDGTIGAALKDRRKIDT